MRILWSVLWAGAAICSWASGAVATQATLVGDLCVYHLDGTTSKYPVSVGTGEETVVEIAKGVKVHARIGELPGFDDLVRVDHTLEKADGSMVSLSWVGIPRRSKYNYGICESLYNDNARWTVKRPLSGIVPGELRILAIRDDLKPRAIKFDLDLAGPNTVTIAAGIQLTITPYWSRTGLVAFAHRFSKAVDGVVVDEWDGPGFSVLPGTLYLFEFADSVYEQREKRPNQALLPTSTAVTPAADAPVAPAAAAADL